MSTLSNFYLAFGRAMIECLGGKKNFNRKSIYRALGVIGHFYGDMDKEKVTLDIAIHNNNRGIIRH